MFQHRGFSLVAIGLSNVFCRIVGTLRFLCLQTFVLRMNRLGKSGHRLDHNL